MGKLGIADTLPSVIADATDAIPPAAGVGTFALATDQRRGDRLASWLLRTGLAFVFLYAAMSSFLHPETFAGYFPAFLPQSWATDLLPVFAAYEVLLATALWTQRLFRPAAVLAALTLAAITASNPDSFEVLFRNVGIGCAALALAAQTPPVPALAAPAPAGEARPRARRARAARSERETRARAARLERETRARAARSERETRNRRLRSLP